MAVEYILYADESEPKGVFFSDFFGGALIRSQHEDFIVSTLSEVKTSQNLFKEMKWSKVTDQYLDKYMAVMDTFFNLIHDRYIKVRIMFTKNANVPQGLDEYQRENKYYLLYYQFIKHGFGLAFCNPEGKIPIRLKILLDNIPDELERKRAFKRYLLGLNAVQEFRSNKLTLTENSIGEIDSANHVILQCLDVTLGAMQFRLNNKHLEKPPGAAQRGRKTIAKEKLYKFIRGRICQDYPNFNIGVSTGDHGNPSNRWLYPYAHWCFTPRNAQFDHSKTKHYNGK